MIDNSNSGGPGIIGKGHFPQPNYFGDSWGLLAALAGLRGVAGSSRRRTWRGVGAWRERAVVEKCADVRLPASERLLRAARSGQLNCYFFLQWH